ncbi:class D sortase [Mesobacillus harenae]|uniref:class D sortase n=1 Tax=Mesobacillus harenae TaxID=2213203 RepID=UPI00157FFE7B|nr:class D sortase [Mesobacillus harenae]
MGKLGNIMLLVGVLLLSFSLYKVMQVSYLTETGLVQAKDNMKREYLQRKEQFAPLKDEAIGILKIPKLDYELPIYEGADEDSLEKGVGHYPATAFPGQGEQILLSGHRDTVFRKFGQLEEGDIFIVKMPYGTYEYTMKSSKIVDQYDRTIIKPAGKEELVLSTCYPFSYIGNAPDRYIIYADPIQ